MPAGRGMLGERRSRRSWPPGAEFTVCVTRRAELPAIPSVLAGRGITTVGRYVVHVDDFRDFGR